MLTKIHHSPAFTTRIPQTRDFSLHFQLGFETVSVSTTEVYSESVSVSTTEVYFEVIIVRLLDDVILVHIKVFLDGYNVTKEHG